MDKTFRLLCLHERLSRGETIVKRNVLLEFEIPPKTFQRDIDSLRLYYYENGGKELFYDRKNDCYRFQDKEDELTKKEIFALCKVLIESRAFNRDEFNQIIVKLLNLCEVSVAKEIRKAISNEQVNYVQLQHGSPIIDALWDLTEFVIKQRIIIIKYMRMDGTIRTHEIKPVGIMFSEFYFYLIAFMADDRKKAPTVFRVDRIKNSLATKEHFSVPYAERFSESEFRKRVQFMYAGELQSIRFEYRGALEAVLDRLPTARLESETDEGAIIRAEVYGNGVDMWIRSQGDWITVL